MNDSYLNEGYLSERHQPISREDRKQLLIHAIVSTYHVSSRTARKFVGNTIADELLDIEIEMAALTSPYRRARRWTQGLTAARDVMFMRQMRLRAMRNGPGERPMRVGKVEGGVPRGGRLVDYDTPPEG